MENDCTKTSHGFMHKSITKARKTSHEGAQAFARLHGMFAQIKKAVRKHRFLKLSVKLILQVVANTETNVVNIFFILARSCS
jgi:hypothetical protein